MRDNQFKIKIFLLTTVVTITLCNFFVILKLKEKDRVQMIESDPLYVILKNEKSKDGVLNSSFTYLNVENVKKIVLVNDKRNICINQSRVELFPPDFKLEKQFIFLPSYHFECSRKKKVALFNKITVEFKDGTLRDLDPLYFYNYVD